MQAQTEKNVDKQSLVWARYYNQLELNKNGLFILKLIIGFYKCQHKTPSWPVWDKITDKVE
jgi:hypothetical protein